MLGHDILLMDSIAPSFRDLVLQGKAQVVLPTTDTGYRSYGPGRIPLPAATNYCTNPSFEVDSNSDGTADGWAQQQDITGTAVRSRVAGRNGGYAQRLQYTGVAGDAAKVIRLYFNTAAASFAAGEAQTTSVYIKGSLVGCAATMPINSYTSAALYVGAEGSVNITPASDVWQRFSCSDASLGAATDHLRLSILIEGIGEGDTIDIMIDDVLIEKSALLTPYFDGSYPACVWTGAANASTSTRTVSLLKYSTSGLACSPSDNRFTIAGQASWEAGFPAQAYLLGLATSVDGAAGGVYYSSSNWQVARTETSYIYKAVTAGIPSAVVARLSATGDTPSSKVDVSVGVGSSGTQAASTSVASLVNCLLYVGRRNDAEPTRFLHGYASFIIWSPVRKSQAWVDAYLTLSSGERANGTYLFRYFMDPGDLIIPLMGDSTAYMKTSGSGLPLETSYDTGTGNLIVFHGDSLTYGTGSSGEAHHYPNVVVASLTDSWEMVNAGTGGNDWTDTQNEGGWKIDPMWGEHRTHNILCVMCGVVNLSSTDTSAAVYAKISAYVADRQAYGWTVVLGTVSPRTDNSSETMRGNLNTLIIANSAGADAIADFSANENIGTGNFTTKPAYWFDAVHMGDAGYAVLAGYFKTAIEGLL